MRKDHPLAKKTSILPKDLNGLPVLTSNQTMVHNEISGWFGRNCESLNITATYNLIYNATLMVDEGVGCALCIDGLVNTGEESSLCFRPLKPRLEARLDLVWKKSQLFSGAARKFLEELRRNIHSSWILPSGNFLRPSAEREMLPHPSVAAAAHGMIA